MKVIFTGAAGLNYKGEKFVSGDSLEVSEQFYNAHKTRFVTPNQESKKVAKEKKIDVRNIKPKAAK